MKLLNANGICYQELNKKVRELLKQGEDTIHLQGVLGHRYICAGIKGKRRIIIKGIPGNDTAAYLDGPKVVINGNAQDALANTMNSGCVVIHGNVGDTAGYAMRGGEIYIKGNAGYRTGIHMKEYYNKKPVIVIGGKAGDFLGEYMAGGIIILLGLGLKDGEELTGKFCGTGMHGGAIYLRGNISPEKLGRSVEIVSPDDADMVLIRTYVKRYAKYFGLDYNEIMKGQFVKLRAYSSRPFKSLYAY